MWCKLAISHTADTNILKRANINLANAMARLTAEQQQEVNDRVLRFQPQPLPEIDPKIRDWQKNPDYQREDGRYGH
jgi:hypothetical protein